MERKVRVRFAPSPTGSLHMGGVRTALYNYLFAKQNNGDFILRIEDTDQARYVEGAEQYIVDSLMWVGLVPNEGINKSGNCGPYRQSERKDMYRQYADQLVKDGFAYYAFDTSEELTEMRERLKNAKVASPQYNYVTRETMKNSLTLPEDEVKRKMDAGEPYVIRIKIPRKEEVRVKDRIRGWVVFHSSQMDDKVLFKSDGMPTYHLANVVDDHLMDISHVIRGEEWLPSAPLHVLLYKYLGWEDTMPEFAHLPLILKPDGNGKLSKRDGDRLGFPVFPLQFTDPETKNIITGYREEGYLPEAFINMLAMLGWNPGTPQELFTIEELIETFTLERVNKHGAKFDADKTKWYNQQYIRNKPNADLALEFKKALDENNVTATQEYTEKVCELIKEKATFINDFWSLGDYFFQEPKEYDAKVIKKKWKPEAETFFTKLAESFNGLTDFSEEKMDEAFNAVAAELEVNPGSMKQPFRVAISGIAGGPSLFAVAELLGKDKVVSRLNYAVANFKNLA
ncbi:MAG: glutamyl-tRNA synthetase [Sphingobacteriales bacterium]|jgi:glutamyl-tRNA synthetase